MAPWPYLMHFIKNKAITEPGLFGLPVPGTNYGLDLWVGWGGSETKVHSTGIVNFTR